MTKDLYNDMLNGLISRLQKLEVFTLEQLPDVCKEILELEKVTIQNNIASSLIGMVVTLVIAIALFMVQKHTPYLCWIFIAVSLAMALLFFSDSIINVLKLRELKAAPKLIILRKLSDFIK